MRVRIFLLTVKEDQECGPRQNYKGLPVLSDTRWLTRIDSIDCLLKNYIAVCEALEEVRDSSSGQSACDADVFHKCLLSFEFSASAVICRHVLAYTRPISVALQGKNCDLLKAHSMAQHLVEVYWKMNGQEGDKFTGLWQKIVKIAETLNIEPEKKRRVARQKYRANPPVERDRSTLQSHILQCIS